MTHSDEVTAYVVSNGERAGQLQEAALTARLSDLAVVSSALFDAVAVRGVVTGLEHLLGSVEQFTDTVEDAQRAPTPTQPYRELSGHRVYRRSVEAMQGLDDIADEVRTLLITLRASIPDIDPERFGAASQRLRSLSDDLSQASQTSLIAERPTQSRR